MAISFRTTYDKSGDRSTWETPHGNPQRVKIAPGTRFESGKTYSPNVVEGEVRPTKTYRDAIPDPQLSQSQGLELINQLSSRPSWEDLRGMKEPLVGIDAISTDIKEPRNLYQYLINEMLQNKRGAQLLDEKMIPQGWRRTGGTTWTDPANPNLWRDIKGLLIPPFENPGVYDLKDQPGGGLAQFPQFEKGWAQGDPDKGEGLGITDYGGLMEGILTAATPLKYAKMFGKKVLDLDFMDSSMVRNIKEDFKGRKKGGGFKGLIEDVLNMVGIGNTTKANEFITRKTDTNDEIETEIENIKSDKIKTIELHELTDLKAKRDELWQQIISGNNEPGLYPQWEAIDKQVHDILMKDQGKLQNMKKGGIATLATGGFLEEQHKQPTNPLLQPTNMGGGFGNQFEDITNKLTSMEEGIATLNNRMALPQQGQSPWMLGRYG